MGFGFNNHLGSNFGFNSGGLSNYFGNQFSIAKSFYFDGVSKYMQTNNTVSCLDSQNFSMEFYVKRPRLNKEVVLFNRNNVYRLRIDTSDNLLFYAFNSSGVSKNSFSTDPSLKTALNTTDWLHIVATYQYDRTPKKMFFYVNGVEYISSVESLDGTLRAETAFINFFKYSSVSYESYLNRASFYDITLTSSQVTDLYNNGKPKDPQALFGANCKFFFNPDNSGDTAQFTVTDSTNSIDATSVNMSSEDKTPLTPYADPIADLVTTYGFLNAWSGENIEINGTTTTAKDYASEHDLSNPAVANQPTFVGGDSGFNNRPTLFFNVDDYLYKATANWRSVDTSGVFIVVFSAPTTTYGVISTSDEATNSYWYAVGNSAFKSSMLKSGANHITTLTNDTTAKVVGMSGDGVNLKGWLNGVDDTDTTGSYGWLDDFPTQRDNIVIGGVQRSSALYSANTYVAFVGYLPYTDDATIIACQNELKTIFGI